MKDNIEKAFVKIWEELFYFQHFMQILSLPQISDYHHLKIKLFSQQVYSKFLSSQN